MTCQSKNRGKSKEKPDEENFRNESDEKCVNNDSSNKTECENPRDTNELRKPKCYDGYTMVAEAFIAHF